MRAFPSLIPILLLAPVASTLVPGCTSRNSPQVSASYKPEGLLLPSKDHLWAAGGRHFSASEFEALEERFPPVSASNRLRLSQYLSLHSTLVTERRAPSTLSLEQFADDLRGLFPPAPSGFSPDAYEKRLREVYGAASSMKWREELDRRIHNMQFEWNHALLDEYDLKP